MRLLVVVFLVTLVEDSPVQVHECFGVNKFIALASEMFEEFVDVSVLYEHHILFKRGVFRF